METFYEWLKNNKNVEHVAKEISSQMIIGYSDLPIRIEDEPRKVTIMESARLIEMEKYVNLYMGVNDNAFNEMLKDRHLKKHHSLAAEYLPTDGGLASDLRNDGWQTVARCIAFNRNRVMQNQDIKLPKPQSKLKTCIIDVKNCLKEMVTREM